ncbi:MAG: guanylate kinase [Planctomycetota bacterium]|jgi:guanylate kinase
MSKQKNEKGKVVIISGPSGVGKSTICRGATKRLKDVHLSVSVTTRPQSESEVDGRDYWFVSKEQFQDRIDKGLLLEHAEVFGNLYGTPRDKVDEMLEAGKTVILEIDVQGAKQAKVVYPEAKMIFILPPTPKDLTARMNHRGREDAEEAEARLDLADDEIAAAWQYYNNMVINDELEQAINEVVQIIQEDTGDKKKND